MILTVTANPAVDHTLYVERIALHDANRVRQVERDAGGKGINASRVIAALGGHTVAIGFLGGGTGAYVRHALVAEGVRHHFVDTRCETRINFAVEDGSDLPPTCFSEPGSPVSEAEMAELVSSISERLRRNDWLLAAGSLPPGSPTDTYKRLGLVAKERGAFFAVDADGETLRFAFEGAPVFVKPNVSETQRLVGRSLDSLENLRLAAIEIRTRMLERGPIRDPIVVISRGAEGAIMADGEGVWIGRSRPVHVQSSVGSGDSMVGAMLLSLNRGQRPIDALMLGMAAGAATAESSGAGLATRSEVERLLASCKVTMIAEPVATI